MPTLLQINIVANYGSTGRIADEIGELAIENGWESYIAYGRKERPSKSKLIKIGSEIEIKMHGLKTRLFDRHGFGSKKGTLNFIEQIKEIKPDIIHLHNIHGYYINIEILFNYLKKSNIPVVWTLHDCWPFTGHCSYFDFANCNKWEKGCFSCPQKNEYPASYLVDNSKQNYKDKKRIFNSVNNLTIVPVSNWLKNNVSRSFLNDYPLRVINNGIDLKKFYPINKQELNFNGRITENSFVLLGVASIWEKRKGLLDFIKLSTMIDSETLIILVGVNDKQLKLLPKNVIGISRTENINQLVEIYTTADLFLNLTYEDNFPTTNIEALACGTPVLTYNTGGSIEAVSVDTGFIIEKGDFKGLLEKIDIVRKKGKSFYSENCRSRATRLYNKNQRYKEYVDMYREILKIKKC